MFTVELEFADGVSQPEVVLVRRPQFVIGATERAHVVVDGMANSSFEMQVVRGVGNTFTYQSLKREDRPGDLYEEQRGVASGEMVFKLGDVTARVRTIDLELAGLRSSGEGREQKFVYQSLKEDGPDFPAVVVFGTIPISISLPLGTSIFIGRSRACAMRIEAADVSSEHAKLESTPDGIKFTDLDSKNGSFIGDERIKGSRIIVPGELVRLGGETILTIVRSERDYQDIAKQMPERALPTAIEFDEFPRLISVSEQIKPQQLVLKQNRVVSVGRDPSNDIWINIPHVSRKHLEIKLVSPQKLELTDMSSNGTFIDGKRLPRDQSVGVTLSGPEVVIDFTSGITLIVQSQSPASDLSKPVKIDSAPPQKIVVKGSKSSERPQLRKEPQQISEELPNLGNNYGSSASQLSEEAPGNESLQAVNRSLFVSEELEPVEPELPENSPMLRYLLIGGVIMLAGFCLFLVVSLLFDRSFY